MWKHVLRKPSYLKVEVYLSTGKQQSWRISLWITSQEVTVSVAQMGTDLTPSRWRALFGSSSPTWILVSALKCCDLLCGNLGFIRPQRSVWLACSKVKPMLTSLTNRWVIGFQRAWGSMGWCVGIRLRLSCTDAMSVWTALHVKVVYPKGSAMLQLKTELSTLPENAWLGQKVLMCLCQPVDFPSWGTHDLTWYFFQMSFSKYNFT